RNKEMQQNRSQQAQMTLMSQAGQLAKAPVMDPDKNPAVMDALQNTVNGIARTTQPAPQS
ncbi:MAG: hypothetical protein ACO24P_07705, partial [Candidatus Nanopelagicaceae bacterium]